jgi:phosphatidylethanolamine/phosphatidyl-N-methylethanolamine N-methyltransferase
MPDRIDGEAHSQLVFIREFLKHPRQVQSLVPSSLFLRRRIVQAAGAASSRLIIELGPGTGATTRALLRAMPPDARLLSVEINPALHRLVSAIGDRRLIAHRGDASELEEILGAYGLPAPDAIVSGIPFSAIDRDTGLRIIKSIAGLLPAGGRFVAYQVRDTVAGLCAARLRLGRVETEFLNIPPMRVYRWEKPDTQAAIS